MNHRSTIILLSSVIIAAGLVASGVLIRDGLRFAATQKRLEDSRTLKVDQHVERPTSQFTLDLTAANLPQKNASYTLDLFADSFSSTTALPAIKFAKGPPVDRMAPQPRQLIGELIDDRQPVGR